jgi:purine-binding chemotaxis protein CheW
MLIEEILIVRHGEVAFGLPTAFIGQILRVPDITPLALSPDQVRGLSAVGGNIATVLDLNLLLGLPRCSGEDPKNRVITLGVPLDALCLLVDEVSVSITVEPSSVEYLNEKKDVIMAIVHYGDELIQVVDLEYALGRVQKVSTQTRKIAEKSTAQVMSASSGDEWMRYLVFKMGGEEYALLIDNLREILNANVTLTHIAGSNSEIKGMMSLRHELIVVADLRLHYNYTPNVSEKNRIMIVERHGKTLGLMVDEIMDIYEFAQSAIDVNHEGDDSNKIEGIVQYEDRLISLLGHGLVDSIIARNEDIVVENTNISVDANQIKITEVVIFTLGDEEYAFPIEEVAEIIDMTPVTPIVNAPKMVDGVINIRGQIVTIGSLHKRLGIDNFDPKDQKILICHAKQGRIGFFVNNVSDVLGVTQEQMRLDESSESIFSNVLHLEDGERLVLLFAPDVSKLVGEYA